MKKLYVVGRPSTEPGKEIETRSEWAVWAESAALAADAYNAIRDSQLPFGEPVTFEEGEVPDDWYNSDIPAEVTFVGELEVYGPYAEKQ